MSCEHDEFLEELRKIGIVDGKEVVIGQRYYVVDRTSWPMPIRIRAFTVMGKGAEWDAWQGEMAMDGSDPAQDLDEAVRLTDSGAWENWTRTCELSAGDLFDSPEEARVAAVRRIERDRISLKEAMAKLRSDRAALRKWDGVLCEPQSDQ